MKYWEEMQSKWGFSDGDATPTDAYESREVYVAAVNTIAARLGSGFRYEPFDRGGFHNSCLVMTRRVGQSVEEALAEHNGAGEDDALRDAVVIAEQLELDRFVRVSVVADLDGAAAFLAGMDDSELRAAY